MNALGGLLGALALTVVAEAAMAALLGLRTAHTQAVLALINTITNPALTLTLALLRRYGIANPASPFAPVILALEAVIVLTETALLRGCLKLPWLRCLALSAACNGTSWVLGAALFW
jgi:hypothetical protein